MPRIPTAVEFDFSWSWCCHYLFFLFFIIPHFCWWTLIVDFHLNFSLVRNPGMCGSLCQPLHFNHILTSILAPWGKKGPEWEKSKKQWRCSEFFWQIHGKSNLQQIWLKSKWEHSVSHYAIFLFTSVHTTHSLSWWSRQLRKLLLFEERLRWVWRSCRAGPSYPHQIPQARHCLHSSAWKFAPQTQPHWLPFTGGGCLCAMSQSENEWVPCLAVSQGLSLL